MSKPIDPDSNFTIAVDFDGTIAEHDVYPRIGAEIPGAIEVLRGIQRKGYTLILWTCRERENLGLVLEWLKERGVVPDHVNEPAHDMPDGPIRKVHAHVFIDDRGLLGLPDWGTIALMLKIPMDDMVPSHRANRSLQPRCLKFRDRLFQALMNPRSHP